MPHLALITLLLLATTSLASQNVALVIGDDTPAAKLQSLGYHVTLTGLTTEKHLLRTIESWTSTTPTNGTALVHLPQAEIDKPHPITKIADLMSTRGGSSHNIIADPSSPHLDFPLPAGCTLTDPETSNLSPPTPPIRTVSPPETFRPGTRPGDHWVNALGMVFVWCPPGKYTAGSPPGTPGRYPDETPREVTIPGGFWIGKYELTISQSPRSRSDRTPHTEKNLPLNDLHWDDGSRMTYKTLTEQEQSAGRLPADWQYSLPTSDQWEYAARAGTTTRYYFGDDMAQLPQHANFADKSFYDSGDIYSNHAHRTLDDGFVNLGPVGHFKPNPWGLHDVYGNVYEWCIDKSARGGSWVTVPQNCRSAYLDHYASRDQQPYLGYRLVIQKTPQPN